MYLSSGNRKQQHSLKSRRRICGRRDTLQRCNHASDCRTFERIARENERKSKMSKEITTSETQEKTLNKKNMATNDDLCNFRFKLNKNNNNGILNEKNTRNACLECE